MWRWGKSLSPQSRKCIIAMEFPRGSPGLSRELEKQIPGPFELSSRPGSRFLCQWFWPFLDTDGSVTSQCHWLVRVSVLVRDELRLPPTLEG